MNRSYRHSRTACMLLLVWSSASVPSIVLCTSISGDAPTGPNILAARGRSSRGHRACLGILAARAQSSRVFEHTRTGFYGHAQELSCTTLVDFIVSNPSSLGQYFWRTVMPWGGSMPGYKDGGALSGLHTKEYILATLHPQFGHLRLGCRTPSQKIFSEWNK